MPTPIPPDLQDDILAHVCQRCHERYGAHFGSDCPDRQGQFTYHVHRISNAGNANRSLRTTAAARVRSGDAVTIGGGAIVTRELAEELSRPMTAPVYPLWTDRATGREDPNTSGGGGGGAASFDAALAEARLWAAAINKEGISRTYMWSLDDALELVRILQPHSKTLGYHIAIGGGVINNGHSDNDLDLYFLPLSEKHVKNPLALRALLKRSLNSDECFLSTMESWNAEGQSQWDKDYPPEPTWVNGRFTYWVEEDNAKPFASKRRIDVFIA